MFNKENNLLICIKNKIFDLTKTSRSRKNNLFKKTKNYFKFRNNSSETYKGKKVPLQKMCLHIKIRHSYRFVLSSLKRNNFLSFIKFYQSFFLLINSKTETKISLVVRKQKPIAI